MSRQPAAGWLAIRLVIAIVSATGCATSGRGRETAAPAVEPMTQVRLERIFADEVDAIVGPPGAIHTQVDGIPLYCISDAQHDRVSFVAPIARMDGLDARLLEAMLEANFHRSLDARYALSEGVVYGVFSHPISTLSPELIRSAMEQVLNLVRSFGRAFSAGSVEPGMPDGQAP